MTKNSRKDESRKEGTASVIPECRQTAKRRSKKTESFSGSIMASLSLQTYQSTGGGRSLHARRSSVEENVRCGCHAEKVTDNNTTRKAKIKLVIACLVALVFMVGEVVGELQI